MSFDVRLLIEALEAKFQFGEDGYIINSQQMRDIITELTRLCEYDDVEAKYTAGHPGASVEDCTKWLLHMRDRLRGSGVAATLERRLFEATVEHLTELRERRKGADAAKNYERARAQAEHNRKQRQYQEQNAKRESSSEKKTDGWDNRTGEHWKHEDAEKIFEFFRRYSGLGGAAGFAGSANFGDFFSSQFKSGSSNNQQSKANPKQPEFNSKARWFEVLGVSITATRSEINAAYRRLATQHHPDKGGSTEVMAAINAARDEGLAGCRY